MNDLPDRDVNIYNAARQLPPERRGDYLDEACAGDNAFRRQMEELLDSGEQAAGFLEGPGDTLRITWDASEKPGDRIGRYRLVQQIGVGGCGIVYLAEQEEPVRRQVALKVIKLGMDTREVMARFEAERQALALMDHPNIAMVLDAGATDKGRPYFVMELVRGLKITDYCDQNNLPTAQRLDLFIQICRAIQHAHQKGIIHRDIKPSNILVTVNDGVAVPKVIDFGIAKATNGKLTDLTVFTAFQQFLGTPAYMSPEQAGMRGTDVDTRSDIYSLGILLYELLTGHTPFDAKELLQTGLDEVRRVIRDVEPVQPSTRLSTMGADDLTAAAVRRGAEPPKLIQSVRGDLDWIVMKALEKNRARRYETAAGLAADIERHLNREPVLARPPSSAYRLQKLVQRHKLIFAAAGAIVVALAIGIGLSVRGLIVERRARVEAERQRQQALANEEKMQLALAKSQQVAQFLEDMLNGVGPSAAQGRDTTMLKEILDKTAKRVRADLSDQPAVEAELCYTLGEVYWELGDLEHAAVMHRTALDLRTELFGTNNAEVALSMKRLGHVLWRQGRLEEAGTLARAGIAVQENLFGRTNIEVARSIEDYAAILFARNNTISAFKLLREALADKEAALGHDNLEVADAMQDLAMNLYSSHSKSPEVVRLLKESDEIRRKILGADNPLVTIALLREKAIEFDLDDHPVEEEAALKELIAAQRKILGPEHPVLAQSLNLLASVLRNDNKLAESEPVRREALAMQRKLLGDDNMEVAQTWFNLSDLLTDENKLAEAEAAQREALRARRKVYGHDGILTGESLAALGGVLEKEGKFKEAMGLYLDEASSASLAGATAQYCLGAMYLHGSGVEKNAAEAANWYRRAADLGYLRAEVSLAALYFDGTGVPADERHALALFDKAAERDDALAMKTLARCYLRAGRSTEGISVLNQFCQKHSKDSASLMLAACQAWFAREADYKKTCRRLMAQAVKEKDARMDMRASKAACLMTWSNADLMPKTIMLAKRGAEIRRGSPWLPWYQLSVGMAEYRNGQYTNAESILDTVERTSGRLTVVPETARLFRAMSVFRLGRIAEARKLFSQSEEQMAPFPKDENRPIVDGDIASHDVMICWIAYREARSMLNSHPATSP